MFLLGMHFAVKFFAVASNLFNPTFEIISNIIYAYQPCVNQNMLLVTFKNLTL